MPDTPKPIANSLVVLREEFDDWAILFDPATGNAFGLNPVGVFVWKCLDGNRTIKEIVNELRKSCGNVPEKVADHLREFIQELVEQGLAGYETQRE